MYIRIYIALYCNDGTSNTNCDHYLSLQDQLTALMVAARNGHTAVVKELLTRQDLNINMTDEVHSIPKNFIIHSFFMLVGL